MKRKALAAIVLAVATLALSASARAAGGVIEINQAVVNAAGGFPYKITTPGSYRPSGNLTDSSSTADAIEINASNVTIDLNGFSINGPNGPSFSGVVQQSGGTLTVENGSITGFSHGFGVSAFNNAIIRNLQANANSIGIGVTDGSVIPGITANGNAVNGIFCDGSGCLITGNTVLDNTSKGIVAIDGTTGYGGNVLNGNSNNVSGGTSLGHNLCSGVVC